MEIYLDCLPCILRQALEASRISTEKNELHCEIMDEAICVLSQYKSYQTPPQIVREMHRIVKDKTGVTDPYYQIKQRDLQTALKLYPELKKYTVGKDFLYWALKVAATGNVLDSGIYLDYGIEKVLDTEVKQPFAVCDIKFFKKKLGTAKNILIIGDNAGETVFDRILLGFLWNHRITYAVKEAPIINDATTEDAHASGLDQYAQIITTGSDVPGVKLGECSNIFLDCFYNADIVISKGQGNYETLSDCDRDIFFLLKAKCPVVAGLLSVDLNAYVFKYMDGCRKER